MKKMTMEALILEAQENNLERFRKDLMYAKTEEQAARIFRKINRTSRFIAHVKRNGFCKEA